MIEGHLRFSGLENKSKIKGYLLTVGTSFNYCFSLWGPNNICCVNYIHVKIAIIEGKKKNVDITGDSKLVYMWRSLD